MTINSMTQFALDFYDHHVLRGTMTGKQFRETFPDLEKLVYEWIVTTASAPSEQAAEAAAASTVVEELTKLKDALAEIASKVDRGEL